ncbi:hypothetical protein [uncultured Chryseobacterium sp.]|uniref:hypothetical protein n=1 Tax=uncultured Chryseobacterium sp. TaxID=259322 RepID=UPI0025EAD0FE|nr:hypothetical protein [uncultured Chryseobacterium sp.]
MTTRTKAVLILFIFATLLSCHKEVKSRQGGIDMISNVYFNASKGLDQMQTFHVSKMNYLGDSILEIIPDHTLPGINSGMNFISDSLYYSLQDNPGSTVISELIAKHHGKLVYNKKAGAIFSKEDIPNYNNRRKLSDTVLFKKNYKRFEINSPWMYTRFYIYPTDTILPYSLYRHVEEDYGGRLERIDSYNKKTDAFVTLQIIPRHQWDDEAKDFFSFNRYIQQKSNK